MWSKDICTGRSLCHGRRKFQQRLNNYRASKTQRAIPRVHLWEERFYIPSPPGSDFRDCKCARIETRNYIDHPLWVVVVVVGVAVVVHKDMYMYIHVPMISTCAHATAHVPVCLYAHIKASSTQMMRGWRNTVGNLIEFDETVTPCVLRICQ